MSTTLLESPEKSTGPQKEWTNLTFHAEKNDAQKITFARYEDEDAPNALKNIGGHFHYTILLETDDTGLQLRNFLFQEANEEQREGSTLFRSSSLLSNDARLTASQRHQIKKDGEKQIIQKEMLQELMEKPEFPKELLPLKSLLAKTKELEIDGNNKVVLRLESNRPSSVEMINVVEFATKGNANFSEQQIGEFANDIYQQNVHSAEDKNVFEQEIRSRAKKVFAGIELTSKFRSDDHPVRLVITEKEDGVVIRAVTSETNPGFTGTVKAVKNLSTGRDEAQPGEKPTRFVANFDKEVMKVFDVLKAQKLDVTFPHREAAPYGKNNPMVDFGKPLAGELRKDVDALNKEFAEAVKKGDAARANEIALNKEGNYPAYSDVAASMPTAAAGNLYNYYEFGANVIEVKGASMQDVLSALSGKKKAKDGEWLSDRNTVVAVSPLNIALAQIVSSHQSAQSRESFQR